MLALRGDVLIIRGISEQLDYQSQDEPLFSIEEVLQPDVFNLQALTVEQIRGLISALAAGIPDDSELTQERGLSAVLENSLEGLVLRSPRHAWEVVRELHDDEDENVQSFVMHLYRPLWGVRREIFGGNLYARNALERFFAMYVRSEELDLGDYLSNCHYVFNVGPEPTREDFEALMEVATREITPDRMYDPEPKK